MVAVFDVPLFFLIAGYFFHRAAGDGKQLIGRVRRLLSPYVLCVIVCSLAYGIVTIFLDGPNGSWASVAKRFVSGIYGSGASKSPLYETTPFGAVWFLLALFWALTIYDWVVGKKHASLITVLLFIVATLTRDFWLPFSIQAGMGAVLFVHIGWMARNVFDFKIDDMGLAIPLISLIVLLLAVGYGLATDTSPSWVGCKYPCLPLNIIAAVAGSIVIIRISALIERIPLVGSGIEAFGRFSLVVLCWHMFDLKVIPWDRVDALFGVTAGTWNQTVLRYVLKIAWASLGVIIAWNIEKRKRDSSLVTLAAKESMPKGWSTGWESTALSALAVMMVIVADQPALDATIRSLVFSIHIPLFFLTVPLVLHKTNGLRQIVSRLSRILLVPYLFIGALSIVLCGILTPSSTKAAVIGRIIAVLGGMSKTGELFVNLKSVSLVWFIPCLFVAACIYAVCKHLTREAPCTVKNVIPILLSVLGWWMGMQKLWLPWSLDVALFAQVFILIGDLAVEKKWLISNLTTQGFVVCAALWASLALGGYQIEMAIRSYPGLILCVVGACAGCALIYGLLQRVGSRFVASHWVGLCTWFGSNCLVILGAHFLCRQWMQWTGSSVVFSSKFGWMGNTIYELLFCGAVAYTVERACVCLKSLSVGKRGGI